MSTNESENKQDLGEAKPPHRPVGSKTKRRTKQEVEEFITISTKKILKEHLSWTEYMKWCKKDGLGERRCNHYWKICWGRVREKYSIDRNKHIDKHLSHYWELYDNALKKGDITNSRQILNDIVKLMGLAEAEKVEVNNTGEIRFKFGDE